MHGVMSLAFGFYFSLALPLRRSEIPQVFLARRSTTCTPVALHQCTRHATPRASVRHGGGVWSCREGHGENGRNGGPGASRGLVCGGPPVAHHACDLAPRAFGTLPSLLLGVRGARTRAAAPSCRICRHETPRGGCDSAAHFGDVSWFVLSNSAFDSASARLMLRSSDTYASLRPRVRRPQRVVVSETPLSASSDGQGPTRAISNAGARARERAQPRRARYGSLSRLPISAAAIRRARVSIGGPLTRQHTRSSTSLPRGRRPPPRGRRPRRAPRRRARRSGGPSAPSRRGTAGSRARRRSCACPGCTG